MIQTTPPAQGSDARQEELSDHAVTRTRDLAGQALAPYEVAFEQHPQDALAATGKANMLLLLNQPEAALTAYDSALALTPKLAIAWAGKACALRILGREQAALEAYEQALALDPTFAPAYFGKGWILLKHHHLWAAWKTTLTGLSVEQAQEQQEDA